VFFVLFERNQHEARFACCLHRANYFLAYSSTLKMEMTFSSKRKFTFNKLHGTISQNLELFFSDFLYQISFLQKIRTPQKIYTSYPTLRITLVNFCRSASKIHSPQASKTCTLQAMNLGLHTYNVKLLRTIWTITETENATFLEKKSPRFLTASHLCIKRTTKNNTI
jgi:hypothetical protein